MRILLLPYRQHLQRVMPLIAGVVQIPIHQIYRIHLYQLLEPILLLQPVPLVQHLQVFRSLKTKTCRIFLSLVEILQMEYLLHYWLVQVCLMVLIVGLVQMDLVLLLKTLKFLNPGPIHFYC